MREDHVQRAWGRAGSIARVPPSPSNSHFDGAPNCNRLELLKKPGVSSVIAPKAGCQPALVRLRRRWDRAVEVGFCAVKSRAVSNRNCVAVRRGGEQRNENDQSVTQTAQWVVAVNSIRSVWTGEPSSDWRSLTWRAKPAGSRTVWSSHRWLETEWPEVPV